MPAPSRSERSLPSATPASRAPVSSASKAEAPAAPEPKPTDVVVLGPPTEDGAGIRVLRQREDRIEAGEIRAAVEGRPLAGELVALKPRADNPRVCDVETLYAAPNRGAGPSQVANDAYRRGWDDTFGPATTTELN